MTFSPRVMRKRTKPEEEEAQEGGIVTDDLVGPGRQRGHRAGERLPGPERVDGEQRAAVAPAATATTIVSPIAREIARMIAATMPEIAAGTTTRRLVVMPSGAEAVRGLAQRRGHGAHRVLGDRRDERDGQDADADAGGGEVERRRRPRTGSGRCSG